MSLEKKNKKKRKKKCKYLLQQLPLLPLHCTKEPAEGEAQGEAVEEDEAEVEGEEQAGKERSRKSAGTARRKDIMPETACTKGRRDHMET